MKTYIYGLCCPVTEKVKYVGKTTSLKRRFAEHKHNCISKSSYENTHLMHWWKKLAAQGLSPVMVILEEVNSESWKDAECRWIKHFGRKNLCNKNDGGFEPPNAIGRKLSKDQRDQIGRRKKGIPIWDNKKHPCLGVPSPCKGQKRSGEFKALLSQLRTEKNGMRGKHLTDQHKAIISSCHSKPIDLIDNEGNVIKCYASAQSAAKELGIYPDAISRVCSGKYTQTKGFRFRFKNTVGHTGINGCQI